MALFQEVEKENNSDKYTFNSDIGSFYKDELKNIYDQREQEYAQAKERQNAWINNIVSPERIKEWESQGGQTAIETWNKFKKYELLPYVGTVSQGAEAFRLKGISDKIRRGEVISAQEKKQMEEFVLDMAETQTRGMTFGAKALNLITNTTPFALEFGLGLATSGGVASLGAVGSKIAQKGAIKTVKEGVEKAVEQGLGKTIAKGVGKVAYDATINPRTWAFTATRLPQQVFARMGEIELNDSMYVTPQGQLILSEAEANPGTALLKALALTNIESASEMSGLTLFDPIKRKLSGVIAPKVLEKLPGKFASKLTETVEKTFNVPFLKAVEQLGFNGVIEEMGEERVGDILRFAFDLDDKEGFSFEQLLDAVFVSPEQMALEAVSFGAFGVGANLSNAGLKKVSEIYSKDDFLIDAGVFRAGGALDKIDKKVKSLLEQSGKTEEEINTVLQHADRETKVQYLKDKKIDTIEVISEENKRLDAFATSMHEELYNKLIDLGMDKNLANSTALSYGASARKLLEEGNSEEDIRKQLAVEFTKEKVEQSKIGADSGNTEIAKTIISKIVPEEYNDNSKQFTFEHVKKMFKTNANKFVQKAHYEILELEKNKTEEIKKIEETTQKAKDLYQALIAKPLLEKSSKKRGSHKKRNKEKIAEYEIKHGSYQTNLKKFFNIIGIEEKEKINLYEEYVKFIQRQDKEIEEIKSNIDNQIKNKKNEINEAYKVYRFAKNKFDGKLEKEQVTKNKRNKKNNYKKELVDELLEQYSAENLKYVRFQPSETFDSGNANIYYQGERKKYQQVISALGNIVNGSEEETVVNLRNDLEQYDGTNDITFVFGNSRKGFQHIAEKHGIEALKNAIDVVVNGDIKRYVKNKKTVILSKGDYEAVLSLDENGNKKTWLLSGWNTRIKDEKSSDVSGEVGTQSATTQIKPTFSRQDLGAELSNIITLIENGLNPNVKKHEEKNLIMAHASKLSSLDEVIEAGSLIAPSFSITTKESETLEEGKFGEVIFIRNPKKIDYQNDNIYDRDIYSPRMPRPHYDIPNGRVVDSYEYDNLKRSYERDPEKFVEKWGETFDEYFKGAKKVLFLGYTPSGNRKYVPYNTENILKEMNKKGLLNKEDFDYGLSSLLARFSSKQTSKSNLKETAKTGLSKAKDIDKQWEEIKDEYDKLGDKLAEYYYDKWSFYEVQSDAFYALAKNMKKTINDIFSAEVPKELQQEVKEFVEKAKSLPRSYFEAKPMREVELSEFSNVLVRKGELTQEQKQGLEDWGIKVTEYEKGKLYETLETLDKNEIYFQDNQQGGSEPLIAGYNVGELMNKLEELYVELGNLEQGAPDEEIHKLQAKINTVADAMDYLYRDNVIQKDFDEIALRVFYVMIGEELPSDIVEADKRTMRSMHEFKEIHLKKKEKREQEYLGYYTKENNTNFIGVMQSADVSTIPHELAHLYLEALNVLAKTNEKTRERLDEVNAWLGTDGSGYTVEQHEMFAKTYEAYLAKGKAPTNALREVFENFKEWLKSSFRQAIYEGITITPEAQEVFDKMFGQGDYSKKEQAIDELLAKVKEKRQKPKKDVETKNKVSTEKNMSENQKRYKDTAYNILELATGKQKRYLKTVLENSSKSNSAAMRREEVLKLIDEVEDKISVQGIDEGWKEFFTFEEGQDYELAMKAYNAIVEKEYLKSDIQSNYEEEWANEIRESIDEADYQYKKLVVAYKKESKDVALGAFYEWLDGINPEIQEDYRQRYFNDIRQIDRIENQTNVERAKERIIKRALEIDKKQGINSNEGYIEFVKSTIGNLTFLSPEDKARLAVNILDVPSMDMLMGRIDSIMDIAQTMQEVAYRRKLEFDIQKELKTTKNIKKGARTVGKYDYRTNKIFERLREINKLSPERAHELLLESARMAQVEEQGLPETEKLYNKFLKFKGDGRTYADITLMKEIYDEIVKIKLIGKTAKNEQELLEKLDNNKEIERMTEILKNKKKGSFAIKEYLSKMGNLESFFTGIFNAEVKEKYATELLYAETQAQTWQFEQKQKFEKEVARIYGLPQWDWDRQIIKYLQEKHTFDEYRREYDKEYNLIKTMTASKELTKMDIILAYMWSCNDVLKQRLVNMFGEAQLDEMVEMLTMKDIEFAHLMLQTAQSFYPIVNKAFIQKYGLDLPRVSAYFPSKVERGTEIDLFNDYSSKSLNNSFTKERTQSEIAVMEFSNPVAILYNHIDGVAKFGFMSESLDKINLIFKNTTFLKPLIENTYGKDVYEGFMQALLNVTYKAESRVRNGFAKVFDTLSSNWIQANISIKPLVALKQLLSANNYAVDIPAVEWTSGFVKSILDFKNTIDFMWSIPYVRARYGGNYSNEFLKQTIENSAFAKTQKLKDFLAINVKLGDLGSLVFGGKPYIDYLIKKGMSKEEAIKQFVLATNRTQQSAAISSMSNFQVSVGRQPLVRVLTAYRNAQQQYARKCGDAIIEYANGDMSLKQCAKTIFHYMFLQPFIFALAGSGSLLIWLTQDDDDELWADVTLSLSNLCMDAIPLLHDVYSFAIKKLVLKEKYIPVNTPLWGDIIKEIQRISKEDADFEDYIKGWGYLLGNVATGIPIPTVANQIGGVTDIFSDKYIKGLFRIIGYSERRATRMSGETEEKAKKSKKKNK